MKLTCHGAAGTTTGSKHLVTVGDKNILLDCGLFEGKRADTVLKNQKFPFDPSKLDAVILSHAHIDHSGNLPNLCAQGFTGNIYSTFATRDLCGLMLADSAKVQTNDAKFINKRLLKQGREQKPFQPLYDQKQVEACMKQFVALDYHRPFPVVDGVTAQFLDAGHMLGSAQVLLEIKAEQRKTRFLFSGDVGRGANEILRDPEYPQDIDFLLMESTYGGREHEKIDLAKDELCRVINQTLERQGKIIIPSFAVGRVQQLVYVLHQLRDSKCFPGLPIYVDSPLSVNATEVFRLHPECFNEHIYEYLHSKANPFGWEEITYIREVAHSMRLNELKEPAIIISSSGMCEAGRILHHLRNNISDERNTILFVGYCAENTLGAKILRGDKSVNIFGEPHDVKAQIARVDAFSGHADHSELVHYASTVTGSKRQIALVHGEPEYSQALGDALRDRQIGKSVFAAKAGESIEF